MYFHPTYFISSVTCHNILLIHCRTTICDWTHWAGAGAGTGADRFSGSGPT